MKRLALVWSFILCSCGSTTNVTYVVQADGGSSVIDATKNDVLSIAIDDSGTIQYPDGALFSASFCPADRYYCSNDPVQVRYCFGAGDDSELIADCAHYNSEMFQYECDFGLRLATNGLSYSAPFCVPKLVPGTTSEIEITSDWLKSAKQGFGAAYANTSLSSSGLRDYRGTRITGVINASTKSCTLDVLTQTESLNNGCSLTISFLYSNGGKNPAVVNIDSATRISCDTTDAGSKRFTLRAGSNVTNTVVFNIENTVNGCVDSPKSDFPKSGIKYTLSFDGYFVPESWVTGDPVYRLTTNITGYSVPGLVEVPVDKVQ
jgi:hypothetical protein